MPQEKKDFETEEIVDLTGVSVEKCRVCAGVPASKNYGSITCASCKNFFLRVTTAGVEVGECRNFHLCSQQNFRGAGKAKCTPCRYEKCIEVGMIPEIILDFSYFTDQTLNDALNNPATVCSRVPIGYNRTADLQIPQHLLPTMSARSFTRSLVFFADWCRGVKEFWELEENDRILHQKMIPEYNRMVMVQDQGIGGILPLDFFRRL
ncbi:unnamed protein product, partial [Mesorhabditis belari]|uniref:Nuclear receptor domain-containing protein n=1 Tax=Mesorhabditis belari TaxID=2138241 RepID=A0AAF3EC62_9BILA